MGTRTGCTKDRWKSEKDFALLGLVLLFVCLFLINLIFRTILELKNINTPLYSCFSTYSACVPISMSIWKTSFVEDVAGIPVSCHLSNHPQHTISHGGNTVDRELLLSCCPASPQCIELNTPSPQKDPTSKCELRFRLKSHLLCNPIK